MDQDQETRRTKSSTIYAPPELKDKLRRLSEKTGRTQWKILLEALELYETSLRKPKTKEELPVVDKVIWYMEKLAMSIGALKENPSNENLQKTMKTIQQIRERLKVDTAILERAVADFIKAVNTKASNGAEKHAMLDEAVIELNMALKSVLIEIVYTYILKEKSEKAEQGQEQGQ